LERLDPVIQAIERVAELFVLILAASIGLSHFGIGISAVAAVILVVGIAFTFGAQNVISDAISGFIILVDQPFRIGDDILLKEPDTYGTVLQIGARTTRILTSDNREVIIPNSKISESQIVNYTYPDSTYRVQTDLRIAYHSDLDKVREVITDAMSELDGVMPSKPVNVLYHEYGDSARHVRVRWWIDNYGNETSMIDKANAVIETSLRKAGIQIPYETYDLNVKQSNEIASQGDADVEHDNG
jgi:small-conductance mechanosensitive channel